MDIEKLKRDLYDLADSDQYVKLFLSCEEPKLFSCNIDDIKWVLRVLMEMLQQNFLTYDKLCKLEMRVNEFAASNNKTNAANTEGICW